jgi:hypothetical protein
MGHGKILDRPPSYKNRRESEASRTHLEARQGTRAPSPRVDNRLLIELWPTCFILPFLNELLDCRLCDA